LVVDQVGHHAKPEQGYLGQDATLAGDTIRHNHVVGRQAVGRHNKQVIGVDVVDVTDFAATNERQVGYLGLQQRVG
jgi:hypothetical protein